MSELKDLLKDLAADPSDEAACRNILECFRNLPRDGMTEAQLDDFIEELGRILPQTHREKEHIDQIFKAVSGYRAWIRGGTGSITKGLQQVTDALEGIYSREDFEEQLAMIRGSGSERLEQVNRLYQMIDSYNEDALFTNKIGADLTIWDLQKLNSRLLTKIPPDTVKAVTYKVEAAGQRTESEKAALNEFYQELIYEAKVPESEEMKILLLRHILQECQNYPKPAGRMRQIVNYMTENTKLFREDGWRKDSLRLRILKQFIKYGNCLMYYRSGETLCDRPGRTFNPVYIVKGKPTLLSYVQKRYEEEGKRIPQREITNEMILDRIDEQVFDVLNTNEITTRIVSAASQLEELRKDEQGARFTDIKDKIKSCVEYPEGLQEQAVDYYLERVWKKYAAAGFPTEDTEDTIRHYIIHDIYKDNVKPGGTWEILRAADDLAEGRFGENTKRYLYLFAMAFGMTYRNTDVPDYKFTDVELNLFEKFYVDEPQRYLMEDRQEQMDEDGRRGNRTDVPPAGRGINRKNFREIIYLYFIRKPFTTQEDLIRKVIGSDAMIRRVGNPEVSPAVLGQASYQDGGGESYPDAAPGRSGQPLQDVQGQETDLLEPDREFYSETIVAGTSASDKQSNRRQRGSLELYREKEDQALAARTDAEFEEFIRLNYNCRPNTNNLIEIEAQQSSAYREYQFYMIALYGLVKEGGIDSEYLRTLRRRPELLDQRFRKIASEGGSGSWLDKGVQKLGIGAGMGWYEPDNAYNIEQLMPPDDTLEEYEGVVEEEQLNLARRVLRRSDQMLSSCFPMIMNSEKVNRNAVLGVYYYCYNHWKFKYQNDMEEQPIGFKGASEDFVKGNSGDVFLKGADAVLEAAGYRPISRNNLLDLLVVFSIYERYTEYIYE